MNELEFFEDIKTYKFQANRSLGQNFLIKCDVAQVICSQLSLEDNDNVLEIGSGLGSLSYYLVKNQNVNITLIDVDERMLVKLTKDFGSLSNVTVKRQNVLTANLSSYTKIIGNLPYYITSGIIEHILLGAKNAKTIVLMTQKEVLAKLMPNTKDVSPLSLFLNYVASIEPSIIVGRNNFVPVPHVDSAVFKIIPNENIKNANNDYLYKLMCKIFLHRRKTILNCLASLLDDKALATLILKELKTDISLRPEQLGIEFYIALSNKLKSFDFVSKPKQRGTRYVR